MIEATPPTGNKQFIPNLVGRAPFIKRFGQRGGIPPDTLLTGRTALRD
jgi:hypothetical protein